MPTPALAAAAAAIALAAADAAAAAGAPWLGGAATDKAAADKAAAAAEAPVAAAAAGFVAQFPASPGRGFEIVDLARETCTVQFASVMPLRSSAIPAPASSSYSMKANFGVTRQMCTGPQTAKTESSWSAVSPAGRFPT